MEDIFDNMVGRGKHTKRKKSARQNFNRRKDDQRHRQQARKGNGNPSLIDDSSELSLALETNTSMLPKHWQKLGDGKFCKVEEGASGLGQVTMSLVIAPDRSVSAFVSRKKVPSSSNVITCSQCSNYDEVLRVIKAIDSAALCPGNPEEKFVSLCRKRGGCIRGERGNGDVIAAVEDVEIEGPDGEYYSSTVRKSDCSSCARNSQNIQYAAKHVSCSDHHYVLWLLVKHARKIIPHIAATRGTRI